MNNDLKKILQKLENRGGNNGINITFDENGIKGVRGNDGYTPVKGQDYFTAQEIKQIIEIVRQQATPVKGKDYWTAQEVADIIRYIQSNVKDGEDGKDGRDGRDGVDGETPDTRAVAIDAVTLLESFEGDARLSATALRDFEVALDEALKNPDFKISLSADQISGIQDLLPKYPPMNAGGSGATFLKSLRDVDLSALTKNADGKYVLGGGSGSLPDQTGNSGKFLTTDGTDASWATLAGGGDMAAATYDPATIAEQLVGLTATQTLTNKTLTQPTITLKQGTAPTPTAEGDIQWDTDDNKIKIGDGASTKTFSDDSVNAATYQPLDSDLTTIAAANNGSVLAATTASFTTADETKLDGIETGATADQVASEVPFTPAGNLASTDVQAALQELDTEKAASSHTHVLADVTDVTATAAEVNVLDGIPATLTATELGYVDGVTSAIQTQLNNKITAFADPNADRIVFWDDSAGAFAALTASTGLTISATSITVRSASSTQTGIVELSTDAEAVTGADTARATTPANLTARLAAPGAIGGTTPVTVLKYSQAAGDVDALGAMGTTETITWSNATHFTGTVDQSTLTVSFSGAVAGQSITLLFAGSASAASITWPTTTWLDNATGAAPAVPASGETLVVNYFYDGTTYYASATGNYAAYS